MANLHQKFYAKMGVICSTKHLVRLSGVRIDCTCMFTHLPRFTVHSIAMRMHRIVAAGVALLLVCAISGCDRQGNGKNGSSTKTAETATQGNSPYDIMARYFAPYTTTHDDLGFPMKIRNL